MMKLLKVEFRKARAALLALIGVALGLEVYYLLSVHFDSLDNVAISAMLLFFSALAMALFVFIRSVTTYSKELSDKTGYMLFMTPNSARKIMASKYLYTFVNGLVCAVLMGVLAVYDVRLGLKHFGNYESFLDSMISMMKLYGIYVDQILYVILFYVLFEFLSILQTVAVAYLAITLSHTLFHEKKWRWLLSVLLFLAISIGINRVMALFPSIRDVVDPIRMRGAGDASRAQAEVSFWSTIVPTLIPSLITSVVVIAASWLGCSTMLEKEISL